jgi:hypothetical protein
LAEEQIQRGVLLAELQTATINVNNDNSKMMYTLRYSKFLIGLRQHSERSAAKSKNAPVAPLIQAKPKGEGYRKSTWKPR